jgi:hypothetical protein
MLTSSSPDTPLSRLQQIGFQHVGTWSEAAGCLACELSAHSHAANVLYAFVVDEDVVYVGKTIQSLRARMRGYERPGPSQSTNDRSHKKIRELLASGQKVQVLALPDNGLLRYGGFHVNLAAGLEDSIVRELHPKWNMTGKPPIVTVVAPAP